MKVKQIVLDECEEGFATALVELSEREAALIAHMIGNTSGSERVRVQHDGAQVGTDIYNALCELFNRFYDNGVPR